MVINRLRAAVVLVGVIALAFGLARGQHASGKLPANELSQQDKSLAADEKTIRDLIKQLGDESFDSREAADKRLVAIGEPARPPLRVGKPRWDHPFMALDEVAA